jgi:hypothetical protein
MDCPSPGPAAQPHISHFIRPKINLGYGEDHEDGLSSLPELIQFAAEHNGAHLFGLQTCGGEKANIPITFRQLHNGVERTSAWLVNNAITTGRVDRSQTVLPVAIFMTSDFAIFMYMAALLRIGTPVCLATHSFRICFSLC